jgi:hypothetical protein
MKSGFSPDLEQFITTVVTSGQFASRDAVLETAVATLRDLLGRSPTEIPAEHLSDVEAGWAEVDAGLDTEMTSEDWARLHRIVDEAAQRRAS